VDHQDREFVSIGGVASWLGVTTTAVRKFEQRGILPQGHRLEGSRARIWPVGDIEMAEIRIAEQREARKGALAPNDA